MQMTEQATLQYWSSSTNSSYGAVELLSPLRNGGDLADMLAASTNLLDDDAFVMAQIDGVPCLDGGAITKSLRVLRSSGSRARLCLVGRRDALQRIDEDRYDHDQVGLMLDGVDAETPAAQLIWDRIEAVRFHHDFIAAATHSFRLGCALESMLRLAKNMGLCTLGHHGISSGDTFEDREDFDYVQMPSRNDSARARNRAGQVVESLVRSAVSP
ncbi:MAG: hypothetical protein ABI143_14150 [Caldimonas sp.]